MIRRARPSDKNRLCALVERFNDQYYPVPLNLEKTYRTVHNLVYHGTVFMTDNAFIGGSLVDDVFRDQKFLVELGWYAEDRWGLKLLDRFVEEAHYLEADEVRVNHMDTSNPAIARILERRGFKFADASYALRI